MKQFIATVQKGSSCRWVEMPAAEEITISAAHDDGQCRMIVVNGWNKSDADGGHVYRYEVGDGPEATITITPAASE